MRRKKLLWIMVLGLMGLLAPGVARAQFLFDTNDGSITITGYTGSGGDVVIPSVTNGLPVTSIGDYAFAFNSIELNRLIGPPIITNVIIPGSVTNIGTAAFAGCPGLVTVTMTNGLTSIGGDAFSGCALQQVTIPGSVVSIGFGAFFNCTGLVSVTIPSSVTNIENTPILAEGAPPFLPPPMGPIPLIARSTPKAGIPLAAGSAIFDGCSKLTNISVNVQNPVYASAAGVLFNKTLTTLIEYPGGKAGSYVIPGTVLNIGNQVFQSCLNLTGVTMPASVTSIGNDAFAQCTELAGVAIPNSVTVIGSYAFESCASLTGLAIPAGVITIGLYPCANCPALNNITVAASNPDYASSAGVLFDKKLTTLLECPGGKSGSFAIPASVTNIFSSAFSGCAKLSNVTLPNSLTSIGVNTFSGCTSLTSVVIPNSVNSVGVGAFNDCTSLTTVTVGSGVTNLAIMDYPYGPSGVPFAECPKLANIVVSSQNATYSSTNGVLFDKNKTTLLQYPAGKSGTYIIPNSVNNIADAAFQDCTHLTGITIPGSVTNIADEAFNLCTGLKSVTIPNGVTAIGTEGFANCTSLTNVVLGTGLTNGGYAWLAYCTNLTGALFTGNAPTGLYLPGIIDGDPITIYYLPGTSGWNYIYAGVPVVMLNPPNPSGSLQVSINPEEAISAGAQWQVDGGIPQLSGATVQGLTVGQHTITFSTISGWTMPASQTVSVSSNSTATAEGFYTEPGLSAFICVTNPDSTLTIVEYAGQGGDVTIPSTIGGLAVTSIGDNAFSGYTSITNLVVPGSITNIGNYAFESCSSLASVTIADGVTTIGDSAFSDCYSLASVTIPGSVTSIGDSAFSYCTGLTNVMILNGITGIGDSAFGNCTSLASVALSTGVTNIGSLAFASCSSLSSVTIPGSVGEIGEEAFFSCTALTNVTISYGVANIADQAFYEAALTKVIIPGSVTNIGDRAFESCNKLACVTLSNGIVSIGNLSFADCGRLSSILIPGSVTTMGTLAFSSCYTLTNIAVDALNSNYASAAGVLFDKSLTQLIQYPPGLTGSYAIPGGVTSIGDGAFNDCFKLDGVTIPAGVAVIGNDAFEYCGGLSSVVIPASVTSIGSEAFFDCFSLTNIAVDVLSSSYASANGVLFDKTFSTLIQFPNGKNGSYAIPGSVTTIGSEAFENCHLSSITIPDSVANILSEAFWNCPDLTTLTIPGNVASIGTYAFWNCYSLTNLTFAAGVASLGDKAFGACYQLTSIYFLGNPPAAAATVFSSDPGTIYYLPGSMGWTNTYGGLPTALWYQPSPLILNNGNGPDLQNNRFGFTISWATNISVVVEACTNLANPVWQPLQTNALVNGTNYFSDAKWTNYPGRFYRVRTR